MSELKGKMTTGQTMKGTASAAPYIPERMAHKLTFTGAVEAAYDGSANVSVEIPEGSTVTPEDVAAAIEAYMAEHPVEETDPTVPAWAKAKDKPSYTAQEVGALPADTEIPVVPTKVSAFENDRGYLTEHQDLSGYAKSEDIPAKPSDIGAQPAGNYATKDEIPVVPAIPTTLPNPHKLTFSGAVNAEYDGSEAVEVVIPHGGGGGGFELVASVELAENVTSVEVALSKPCTDLIISAYRTYNGMGQKNPHFVKVDDNGTETAVGARYDIFPNNNSWAAWFPATVNEPGNNRNSVATGFYHYEKDIGVFSGFSSAHEARGGYSSQVGMTGVAQTVGDFIETLKFGVNVTDAYIAKGVKIFVWGC